MGETKSGADADDGTYRYIIFSLFCRLWVMMDFRAGNGNEDMKYLMQTHHHHNPWDPWAQVRDTSLHSYTFYFNWSSRGAK